MTDLLAHVTVLELANVLAGPSVGAFLAEMGARVIKVENTQTDGDVTRQWKVSQEDPQTDISSYFSSVNWGKQSLALNLKHPQGLQVIDDLLPDIDIVLTSYKPGDAEKLNVHYDRLVGIHPRLIYGHITGYGLDNPRAGYDALIQAESGFMYMNGSPDGPPLKMPVAMMDILAGHQLKEGILLALLQREQTGKGSYIHVSLLQAGISSLANQASHWLVAHHMPQRMGSEHPSIVPYGSIYQTQDSQIVLAIGNDRQFSTLCQILKIPEVAQNPCFSTNAERVCNRETLHPILQEAIGAWSKEALLKALIENHVPAGAINNMAAVFKQKEAQELLLHSDTLTGMRTTVFGDTPSLSPPPHFGEHSVSILRDRLKYPEAYIQALLEQQIVV